MHLLSNHMIRGAFFAFIIFGASGIYGSGNVSSGEKMIQNSFGMEFVLIPAGKMMMGSPGDEDRRNLDETRHEVILTTPFYMQTTEVTGDQWQAVAGWKLFGRKRKGPEPVVKVSWHDCMKFIEKLNKKGEGTYRLPTEAEWEYACRADSREAYSCGKSIGCPDAMYGNNKLKAPDCVVYLEERRLPIGGPAPVKSYPPNAWGLYDMHGNVWEWCSDWYGPYPEGPVSDPRGPESGTEKGKVRRGGSWFKQGWLCRSANRNYAHPATLHNTLGFRLVREADIHGE